MMNSQEFIIYLLAFLSLVVLIIICTACIAIKFFRRELLELFGDVCCCLKRPTDDSYNSHNTYRRSNITDIEANRQRQQQHRRQQLQANNDNNRHNQKRPPPPPPEDPQTLREYMEKYNKKKPISEMKKDLKDKQKKKQQQPKAQTIIPTKKAVTPKHQQPNRSATADASTPPVSAKKQPKKSAQPPRAKELSKKVSKTKSLKVKSSAKSPVAAVPDAPADNTYFSGQLKYGHVKSLEALQTGTKFGPSLDPKQSDTNLAPKKQLTEEFVPGVGLASTIPSPSRID